MPIIVALIFILSFPHYLFATDYLCFTDALTGFKYNQTKDSWETNKLYLEEGKFLIRQAHESEFPEHSGIENVVVDLEKNEVILYCSDYKQQYLHCSYSQISLYFNSNTLRYVKLYQGSYIDVEDTNRFAGTLKEGLADSPAVEIGKCSALETN